MLLGKGSSESGLFKHLSNQVVLELVSSKIHRLRGSSFFKKMFKIESRCPKCTKKLRKCCFVSDIIASENVAINCLC